jgi:hypothetical protein
MPVQHLGGAGDARALAARGTCLCAQRPRTHLGLDCALPAQRTACVLERHSCYLVALSWDQAYRDASNSRRRELVLGLLYR